ncbi:hypothetical protein KP509_32G076100 [Ceratopteris richardii]|uniref:PhoD-like phosphatase metallophosphatase domain-containing protein n=1 Tax=Ceratopteris richardii TaxID=49495 RepID=A0A8T2QUM2_CERRI|nr:hypothetical protein KP509_32G076100 [Ceratopteris richardii]
MEENNIIRRTSSCPVQFDGPRFSRWGVAKTRLKEKLLNAGTKLHGYGWSRRLPEEAKSSLERLKPDSQADGYGSGSPMPDSEKPKALVGPVIGLVTSTSARILLEVDKDATVEMSLHKMQADIRDDSSPYIASEQLRKNFSNRLLSRFSSSPVSLLKDAKNEVGEVQSFNSAEDMSSAENSVHSSGKFTDPRDEEATCSTGQSVRKLSRLRMAQSTAPSKCAPALEPRGKLEEKREAPILQGESSSRKHLAEETFCGEPAQASHGSVFDVGDGSSSSTPVRKHGSSSLRRRLRFRSLVRFGSSPLRQFSSLSYVSQGDAVGNECISIQKTMKAKRPNIFVFEGLEPGTRYRVVVKDCQNAEESSFKTFPEEIHKLTLASISCNSIFITKKTITHMDDLWNHLHKSVKSNQVDLLVHLGDQIYGDGDKQLDASAGKNRDKWSNRFKIGLDILGSLDKTKWDSKADEICERYREVYRETWKHPYTAKCLAHCPSLMIYDDHEIRDNWGDNPHDRLKDSNKYFVAECAWRVTLEYQRQLFSDVDFSDLRAIKSAPLWYVCTSNHRACSSQTA